MSSSSRPAASVGRALRGRCPACGESPLFDGPFRVVELCERCGVRHERQEGTWVVAAGLAAALGMFCGMGLTLVWYAREGEVLGPAVPVVVAFVVIALSFRLFKSLVAGTLHVIGEVTPDPLVEGKVIHFDRVVADRERRERHGDVKKKSEPQA